MTLPTIETWHSVLPPDVLHRAYSASNGELAWPKPDALQVVAIVQRMGYRILGVDTWLPTSPGPTPLIHDWDESYAVSPADFIKAFDWSPTNGSHLGLETYFNIIVDEDSPVACPDRRD